MNQHATETKSEKISCEMLFPAMHCENCDSPAGQLRQQMPLNVYPRPPKHTAYCSIWLELELQVQVHKIS